MRAHILIVAALWIVFSIVGYAVVLNFNPFPVAASEQAHIVDDAFTFLTLLAIPVFTFVVAVLVYVGFRFRVSGTPGADGPPIRSHTPIIAVWFVITVGLTVFMIMHPGITGIQEIRAHDDEELDLLIQIDGRRFAREAKYLEQGVRSHRELVLPIGKVILFKVTSFDVIHSVWIPAFRMKIDAVPGLTTSMVVVPDRLGTMEEDQISTPVCRAVRRRSRGDEDAGARGNRRGVRLVDRRTITD